MDIEEYKIRFLNLASSNYQNSSKKNFKILFLRMKKWITLHPLHLRVLKKIAFVNYEFYYKKKIIKKTRK